MYKLKMRYNKYTFWFRQCTDESKKTAFSELKNYKENTRNKILIEINLN